MPDSHAVPAGEVAVDDLLEGQVLHAAAGLNRKLEQVDDGELAAGVPDVGAQVAVLHERDDGHGVTLQVKRDS